MGFIGLTLAAACVFQFVDGDTFRLGPERIRPLGYDAPETDRAQCPEERYLGKVAATRARDLLCAPGAAVIVDRGDPPRVDRYGRTLARIIVDGRDLADLMIGAGLARPYKRKRRSWCD